MKCQKCNEREVSFHYISEINGERTEKHLCRECAREEGFAAELDRDPIEMFAGMNRAMNSMFSDFFSPRSLFASPFAGFDRAFRGMMASPFLAAPRAAEAPPAEPEASEKSIPSDAGSDVRARRELEALRAQLEDAVKTENFEKAIELRDQIRRMEG